MNTKRRTFLISVWTLFVGVVVLGSSFLYVIYDRLAKADVVELEARELERKTEQLVSVKSTLRDALPSVEAVNAALIDEDDISSFIDELEALGADTGVSITIGSISVDPIPKVQSMKRLSVRATINGEWDKIMTFSSLIESLPEAISIDSFAASKTPSQDGQSSWSSTIELSVFIRT